MRLACYGWVTESGPSIGSAAYLVVEDLLERGVEIDLYGLANFLPDPKNLHRDRFRYIAFSQPRWLSWVDRLPRLLTVALRRALTPLVWRSWRNISQPVIEREHDAAPYDAVVNFGTAPVFALKGAPSVTWLQGPNRTEFQAIRGLRRSIIRVNGPLLYAGLWAYYRHRELFVLPEEIRSDHLIIGSQWSREALLAEGTRGAKVHVLPLTVDFETFKPDPTPKPEPPIVLWLGRTDPRKRFDLLLAAFVWAKRLMPDLRLRIVDLPSYTPKILSLLEPLQGRADVEYLPGVPRSEVPQHLREATVLVQPSEYENFGTAVAEALASGTPVVIGPTNGTVDYIDENSTVFQSYAPASVGQAIVETVARYQRDPAEVQRTTRTAAECSFAPQVVADRMFKIIEAAVREGANAGLTS